jgi:hypothetical protein
MAAAGVSNSCCKRYANVTFSTRALINGPLLWTNTAAKGAEWPVVLAVSVLRNLRKYGSDRCYWKDTVKIRLYMSPHSKQIRRVAWNGVGQREISGLLSDSEELALRSRHRRKSVGRDCRGPQVEFAMVEAYRVVLLITSHEPIIS